MLPISGDGHFSFAINLLYGRIHGSENTKEVERSRKRGALFDHAEGGSWGVSLSSPSEDSEGEGSGNGVPPGDGVDSGAGGETEFTWGVTEDGAEDGPDGVGPEPEEGVMAGSDGSVDGG